MISGLLAKLAPWLTNMFIQTWLAFAMGDLMTMDPSREFLPLTPSCAGAEYAKKIAAAAKTDAPAFICHYYNFYFAHTAGGRMIGSKVGQMLALEKELKFYQYDGEVASLLDEVRRKINHLAESWGAEQKAHCLAETEASFKYSGKIMECISP